jgi:hypothetical protein
LITITSAVGGATMTELPEVRPSRSTLSRVLSAVLVLGGGALWAIPTFALLYYAPKFQDIFQKFQIPGGLPVVTVTLLALSDFLSRNAFAILPLAAMAIGLLALLSSLRTWRGGIIAASLFAAVSFFAVAIAVAVLVIGLIQPMVALIQTVSNSR